MCVLSPRSPYCRTAEPAGIGFANATPVLRKKIVPRESVAKERWPVDPTVEGTALAQYDDCAFAAEALHVLAAVVIDTTPADASAANGTEYPLLTDGWVDRSGLTKPWLLLGGDFARSASETA